MTEMRRLGATDLATPALVLGGNVFGWTADQATSFAILDRFVERGGTMIDTADVYSAWVPGHKGGESETVLGAWLKQSGKRDQVVIATKVGMLPSDAGKMLQPAHIAAACEASLQRLGTDHIDVYFAHRDDEDTPQEDALAAFGKLVDAGKIGIVGASNFSAGRLKSANDIALSGGLPRYHVLQNEYNLVSRKGFEGELQNYCIEHNIATTPYYGLASGFLTGKYRSAEDFGKSPRGGRMQKMLDEHAGMLAAMDQVASETGATLAEIALAWIAAQPGLTAPIASATSVEQLDELMGALDLQLTRDQLDRLTTAA